MSTTITLAGQKGGGGKSTLAVHLASEWHRRGQRVLLVDSDPQGTALTWAEVASERGEGGPSVVALGDNLRTQLPELQQGYDLTIIDTAGRQSKRLTGALVVSDLALIPCKPAAADVWALSETLELIERVQELSPRLQARIVRNETSRTAMNKAAKEAVEQTGAKVLKQSLGRRVAFAEAIANGQGVTLYAQGTVAARELSNIADEVEELLTMKGAEHAA